MTAGRQVTRREIEAAARNWVRHQRRRRAGHGEWSRQLFIQVATDWLRFLELLAESPDGKLSIHSEPVDDFIAYLRDERGLSPRTISHQRWQIERFLRHVSSARLSAFPGSGRSGHDPEDILVGDKL